MIFTFRGDVTLKQDNHMDSKNLIGGLLVGATVGVAVGLLLSPVTNPETKEKLMKGARKLSDSLGGVDNLKKTFNKGVDELAGKGKNVIDSTSERVKA
jgi:gas vesicle protein